MDWATVGNFSAPATLKIPHVIQDLHNKKNPRRNGESANCRNNTNIITIYPSMRSGNTRKNTADPIYELLTCMSRATCEGLRDMGFLYVLSHVKYFLMAVIWRQCDSRCGGETRGATPPCDPRARGARDYSSRYSPVRNRSASDSRQLRPDSFSAIVWVYGEAEAAILPPYAPLS